MRRLVGAAGGALLLVLFVCWRLWTPIDGARRVLREKHEDRHHEKQISHEVPRTTRAAG